MVEKCFTGLTTYFAVKVWEFGNSSRLWATLRFQDWRWWKALGNRGPLLAVFESGLVRWEIKTQLCQTKKVQVLMCAASDDRLFCSDQCAFQQWVTKMMPRHSRTERIHHSIILTLIHVFKKRKKKSLLFFLSHQVSNYYLWMKCALAERCKECHMRLDTVTGHGISAVGR